MGDVFLKKLHVRSGSAEDHELHCETWFGTRSLATRERGGEGPFLLRTTVVSMREESIVWCTHEEALRTKIAELSWPENCPPCAAPTTKPQQALKNQNSDSWKSATMVWRVS